VTRKICPFLATWRETSNQKSTQTLALQLDARIGNLTALFSMKLCMNFSISGPAAAFSGSAMAYLSESTFDTVRDYIHLKVAGSRT
jgi:hypothetical protein